MWAPIIKEKDTNQKTMFRLHKNRHAKSGERVDFNFSNFKALQVFTFFFFFSQTLSVPKNFAFNETSFLKNMVIWNCWNQMCNVYVSSNCQCSLQVLNNVDSDSHDHWDKSYWTQKKQKECYELWAKKTVTCSS